MSSFDHGDLVRIADDLGMSMSHFQSGCDAVVLYSYDEQYGRGKNDSPNQSYSLHIKGRGAVSWYYGYQLTLIEKDRLDILDIWKEEEAAECKQKGDLDWIFSHWDEVSKGAHGATIEALANGLGITMGEMWGTHGEGYTYMVNSMGLLSMAEPFLKRGDKLGWVAYAKEMGPKVKTKRKG